MKKLIFTLAIMLGVTTMSYAQDAGKIWVGGSVGIKTSKTDGMDRLTSYNILPEVGMVLNDNWGLGIRLGYAHKEFFNTLTTSEGTSIDRMKLDGFTVAPFARFSFLKGDIGNLFIDGGVDYTHSKYKGENTKAHNLDVGFRPGVAVKVSDNIALLGKFGFLGYQYEKFGSVKTNSFGFDFDMSQIQFGANIFF